MDTDVAIIVACILALGRLLDFVLGDLPRERFAIAFRMLVWADFLQNHAWLQLQTRALTSIFTAYQSVFGTRLGGWRYLVSTLVASLVLSVLAMFVALGLNGETELRAAGFQDTSTPYWFTLREFWIETTDKGGTLLPLLTLNWLFDFTSFTVSFLVLRRSTQIRSAIGRMSLFLLDMTWSVVVFVALVVIVSLMGGIAVMASNLVGGRGSTALLYQGWVPIVVAATATIPVVVYGSLLVILGLFRSVLLITGRFLFTASDDHRGAFTQMAFALSSVIVLGYYSLALAAYALRAVVNLTVL